MKKNRTSKNSTRRKTEKKIKQEFPRGWNERKVRAVIQHYDRLTNDELAHEIETAHEVREETLISVPTELLPTIQQLIVRHQPDTDDWPASRTTVPSGWGCAGIARYPAARTMA